MSYSVLTFVDVIYVFDQTHFSQKFLPNLLKKKKTTWTFCFIDPLQRFNCSTSWYVLAKQVVASVVGEDDFGDQILEWMEIPQEGVFLDRRLTTLGRIVFATEIKGQTQCNCAKESKGYSRADKFHIHHLEDRIGAPTTAIPTPDVVFSYSAPLQMASARLSGR